MALIKKPGRIAGRIFERVRRAFSQFLTIPLLVVLAFIAVAVAAHLADVNAGRAAHWGSTWRYSGRYVGDPESATSLLSAIASSLITITSITFSILLLAVQQGASALTSQIIDHYLRRKSNQIYFGCFVGASIYTLITLVLTTSVLRPVLGVMLATVFAGGALFALVLLIYSTIDQIKPVTIINKMHDVAIESRSAQVEWLAKTTGSAIAQSTSYPVVTNSNGYLTRVHIGRLEAVLRDHPEIVIEIVPTIGDYVAYGAPLARVTSHETPDEHLIDAIRYALPIEEQRDITCDASFAVEQLATVGWTEISTAKSNPAAGLIACHALQDILFRWSEDEQSSLQADAGPSIVYHDRVGERLLGRFESLLVVASESMQHQTAAVVVGAMTDAFGRMSVEWKDRVETILLASLAGLGDHMPTRELGESLKKAALALRADTRPTAAARIMEAWGVLEATAGSINARGNRGVSK